MLSRFFSLLLCIVSPVWAATLHIQSDDIRIPAEYLTPVRPNMPAVLIMHGCGGLFTKGGDVGGRMWRMGHLLQEMGYAVLYVDSFTPRGVKQVCTSRSALRAVTPEMRADDAEAAIRWLRAQKNVDGSRIGVLGWSHGADATLRLLGRKIPSLRAAVAYYPSCRLLLDEKDYRVSAPTLVLIGNSDEWTPSTDCRELATVTGQDLFYVVSYPGVKHDFDEPVSLPVYDRDIPNRVMREYDLLAAADTEAGYDANRRTFKWFARWFDPERAIKGVPPSKHSR